MNARFLLHSSTHRVLAAVMVVASPACFEAGPLGGADTPSFDFGPPDIATADPGFDPGGNDPGGIDIPEPKDTAIDTGPKVICDGDAACLGQSTDLCKGEKICLGGFCEDDPDAAVVCTDDGNECTSTSCNPATGLCETTYLDTPACSCSPVAQLLCGGSDQLSSADLGETDVLSNYACGPSGGNRAEHTWLFKSDAQQVVSVSVTADASGGVYVLGYDGTRCVPEACVAGGEFGAAFEAQAGFSYGIVFEHPDGLPVLLNMAVQCGITSEFSCDNKVDDDLNGLTDCSDPACATNPACVGVPETDCDDGIDNDGDSLTDCGDGDCAAEAACDQTCSAVVSTVCNQTYSLGTGGGSANATSYSCGPEAAGKEVAYILPPAVEGNVTITLNTGDPLRLYILKDMGSGCSPFHCETHGTGAVSFVKPPNTTWYAVVDGDEGVTGSYGIDITCQ